MNGLNDGSMVMRVAVGKLSKVVQRWGEGSLTAAQRNGGDVPG